MSTIITHRQFPNYHKYEMELAGRPLTLEVGKLAELANAAVMVGYGDTRVLVLRHGFRPSRATASTSSPSPSTLRRSSTPSAASPVLSTAARAVPAKRAS